MSINECSKKIAIDKALKDYSNKFMFENKTKLESNMEIEYKFWAKNLSKEQFHQRVEKVNNQLYEPEYICSCDDYYIGNVESSFLRYRKGGPKTELTLKIKREGNVVRKEINLNLNKNDDSAIVEFLNLSGYKKQFSIFKEAWIWKFDNCDISYYTLSDGRSVIEIEATKYDYQASGIRILDKWADLLNLQDQVRESRSLYEIYLEESLPKTIKHQEIFLTEEQRKGLQLRDGFNW